MYTRGKKGRVASSKTETLLNESIDGWAEDSIDETLLISHIATVERAANAEVNHMPESPALGIDESSLYSISMHLDGDESIDLTPSIHSFSSDGGLNPRSTTSLHYACTEAYLPSR